MNGWSSQVMASLSLTAWSVMSSIEYSIMLPAVGARIAALRMASRISAGISRSSKTRTDLRALSRRMVSFMAGAAPFCSFLSVYHKGREK